MAATKIGQDTILQINRLYQKYKTYAAVAREIGIAPSTVKKYVIKDFIDPELLTVKKFSGALGEISEILKTDNWDAALELSQKEIEEIEELKGEITL